MRPNKTIFQEKKKLHRKQHEKIQFENNFPSRLLNWQHEKFILQFANWIRVCLCTALPEFHQEAAETKENFETKTSLSGFARRLSEYLMKNA